MNNLDQLNIHDSIIIDKNSSDNTRVVLRLSYVADYASATWVPKRLVFENCYKIVMDMNAGIIAPESILSGLEVGNSETLNDLIDRFRRHAIPLPLLKHFGFETNSTSCTLDIIAESVVLQDE
jgi:hypothetical protein